MSCKDDIYILECGHYYPSPKHHGPEETFISQIKCPTHNTLQRTKGKTSSSRRHTFEELNPKGEIVAVAAACIVQQGYILLQGRENEKRLQDHFELPGGKVEEGETLEEALAREIKEELDCAIDKPKLIHAQINRYPPDPNNYLVLFYIVDLKGEPKPLVGSLHWARVDKVKDLKTLPGIQEILQHLV